MVEVQGVTKRFGSVTVLEDIDLSIPKGAIVAIMGSSGGGKTTLLKCIAGLHPFEKGKITVAGLDVAEDGEEARKRMGLVFQSAALFDFLTVADNILFGIRRRRKLSRKEGKELVANALDSVGLQEDVGALMPSELSGGMKKRVGIARALALEPEVLLYDEPTTGLDPITAYTIDAEIVELRDKLGVTSLVVSHDVSSVFRVADRIAFLEAGKLTYDGDPSGFEKSDREAIRELVDKSRAKSFTESR
jgi:phospholipid/cholesterol/gamma-HCH transport system ATP-binding protein